MKKKRQKQLTQAELNKAFATIEAHDIKVRAFTWNGKDYFVEDDGKVVVQDHQEEK